MRSTVLAKYQRLEAEGLWRPGPRAQRREVIVSIGEATLTITDSRDVALAHWSLPAVTRLNPGERPAVYAPGEDVPETVEISDETMIAALSKVLRAIRRGERRPGRLRAAVIAAPLLAVVVLGAFWLPGALAAYSAGIVPDAARQMAGASLMEHVRTLTGRPCETPSGQRALRSLEARLFPDAEVRLVIVRSALKGTAHLPGGILLASHQLVEDYEVPDVLAGHLVAEDLRRRQLDPFERLLREAGLVATMRLLATGRLPDDVLRAHAERIIAAAPAATDRGELARRLAAAGLSAETLDAVLVGDDAVAAAAPAAASGLVLSDSEWLALQRICED